ncbi:MAG: molybdopterin molybdotransferase MoeA [Corynebacteriales bacterium]|nr:molybdopterin molybdotransferase MoeA [Mycobacteriales bacterium]
MISEMTLSPSGVAEYLTKVLGEVSPLKPLQLSLLDALGSVLAEDVRISAPLPSFDTALTDGYAVAAASVANAPISLRVVGDINAETWRPQRLPAGVCLSISAGAPVPAGADAIVPRGWTDGGVATVQIGRSVKPGHGMLHAGAVIKKGAMVGRRGQEVTSGLVGMLAQAGMKQVQARPRPRVIVLGVGAEYVDPGAPSSPGKVVDAASYVICGASRIAGAQAFRLGAIGDDPERVRSMISDNAMRADLLVATGDLRLLTQVFAEMRPVRLAVEPGGPIGWGRLGEDQTPLLCLSGDAGTASIWFELLVRPLLRRFRGSDQVFRRSVKATLAEPLTSAEGAREFRPGILTERRGGGHVVRALPGGVALLSSLSIANGIIVLSDQVGNVPAGASLDVMVLE